MKLATLALAIAIALSSCAHTPPPKPTPRYRNPGDLLLRTEGPRRHLLAADSTSTPHYAALAESP